MKRLIACAIIAVIIVLTCTFCITTSKSKTDIISEKLNQSILFADQMNFEEADKSLNEAKELWEQSKNVLVIYAEHSAIERIDEEMVVLSSLMKRREENFPVEAELCIELVQEIFENESLSLKTFF